MYILLIVAFIFAYMISVTVQIIVHNPINTCKYAIIDLYEYIKYKKYNDAKLGQIRCYVGLFGKGKTLSAVHDARAYYNKYNNKLVWDPGTKKFIVQKVLVLSNIAIKGVNYIPWTSMRQVVDIAEKHNKVDEKEGVKTVYIAVGDEFSVQMNSRKYRENVDPLFLNTLLTCRHSNFGPFYLTAQRFNHMDALLRQVTSVVIDCDKLWRIQRQFYFDAWEYENATKKTDMIPIGRGGFFVTNKDYEAYDTKQLVGNLVKDCNNGEMLSEKEIIDLIGNTEKIENDHPGIWQRIKGIK